ncbi:MAG: hypothetical protein J6Q93_07895 [Prevotella sp.]|nr:hypothetical protein [Prevotella sp.]
MKKMYITPSVEEIKVNAMNMLAQSDMNLNETETDTSQPGGQLGREDNPSRPNIWEQGW